jgi:hypothetical protein
MQPYLLRLVGILCAMGSAAALCLFHSMPQAALARPTSNAPAVHFQQSASKVDAYDYVEILLTLESPTARNPFTDVTISGQFQRAGDMPLMAHGFCDSSDGKSYRIRFMPQKPGSYSFTVQFQQGESAQSFAGTFEAVAGKRRGILRVDHEHPWHFILGGNRRTLFL